MVTFPELQISVTVNKIAVTIFRYRHFLVCDSNSIFPNFSYGAI